MRTERQVELLFFLGLEELLRGVAMEGARCARWQTDGAISHQFQAAPHAGGPCGVNLCANRALSYSNGGGLQAPASTTTGTRCARAHISS